MKRDDRDVKSTPPLPNADRPFTNGQFDNDRTEHCASYSVLVRTYNSATTIGSTIASLQTQTSSPSRFIFVDSGSSDDTLALLPAGSIVHRYTGREFNYSGAINQGVPYIDTDYVLIMSSHTSLTNKDALTFALRLMEQDKAIGAAYFSLTPAGTPTYELINRATFTGFNGVFNTCGIYRTALLRTRPFRPEVFSAEDQEWSKWLLEHAGNVIARISGGGMIYNNPKRHSLKKWLDEWIAVATFTNRSLLNWYRIARVAGHVVKPRVGLRDRYFYSVLFVVLLFCKLSPDLLKPRHWRYQVCPERQ